MAGFDLGGLLNDLISKGDSSLGSFNEHLGDLSAGNIGAMNGDEITQYFNHTSPDKMPTNSNINEWLNYFADNPGLLDIIFEKLPQNFALVKFYYLLEQAKSTGNFDDVNAFYAQYQKYLWQLSPEMQKYLDDMTARQNTQSNRSWEQEMRDTSLLSSGNQLQQLGLSPSSVTSVGGSNVNGVGTADISRTNLKQQRNLERYNQRMQLAKSVLGMTSSMASAGIYGSAIGRAKKAASVLTSSASHSALSVLYNYQWGNGPKFTEKDLKI